jgi:DNA-binding transcriptional regulator YhcF (GntR family)
LIIFIRVFNNSFVESGDILARSTIERAVSFLRSFLDSNTVAPGSRLPTVKDLAAQCGVSGGSMSKAVQRLKSDGVLAGVQGQPTRVAGGGESISDMLGGGGALRTTWRRLYAQLERDILLGVYSNNPVLLSIKEMQHRYGVSYPTVRKTLRELWEQGYIEPRGNSFRVVPLHISGAGGARIVLLCWGGESGTLRLETPWDREFFRAIEQECSARKITLDTILFTSDSGHLKFISAREGRTVRLSRDKSVLGYIFRTIGANLTPDPDRLLHELIALDKPVAVFDDMGHDVPFTKRLLMSHCFRIFPVGTSVNDAHIVGRYLLEKGHRSIAFISAYHRAEFSRIRFQGLCEIFERAGILHGVHSVTLDTFVSPWDYYLAALRRKYANDKRREHDTITDTEKAALIREEQRRRIVPLLDTALNLHECTAWVTATDSTGVVAYSFLRGRGIHPGKDIALIGFDDSFAALEAGVTTYRFNFSGILGGMIHYIVSPVSFAGAFRGKTVTVDGMIIERLT